MLEFVFWKLVLVGALGAGGGNGGGGNGAGDRNAAVDRHAKLFVLLSCNDIQRLK